MEEEVMESFIVFKPEKGGGKLMMYNCVKKDGHNIGVIRWYGAWRKYCFFSILGIYDNKCLVEIVDFMNKLNKEWRDGCKKDNR